MYISSCGKKDVDDKQDLTAGEIYSNYGEVDTDLLLCRELVV